MPPTKLISIGVPQLMATEDEVFAMPQCRIMGFVNPVAATLEISDAVAGTFVALVLSADGRFETAAPFIRNGTAVACTVVLRAN